MNFELRADRGLVWAAGGRRHVLVRIAAPPGSGDKKRRPVHVSFVVDRSGSMGGPKLALAKTAVLQALEALRGDDRFSVVFYDHEVEVPAPSGPATSEARRAAAEQLRSVQARGMTALHDGWSAGTAEVSRTLDPEAVGRCLLLTDGLANRGLTEPDELTAAAATARAKGVATTTIGLGADFDERLLQSMAEAGGGRFYFVEHPAQIPDCLAGELGDALEVVAREVVLEIAAPAGVHVEPLNPYPFHAQDGVVRIALGDLVAEQELELVVRVDLPANAPGEARPVAFTLRDRDGVLGAPRGEVTFRHAPDADVHHQPRDPEAMLATARLYASRARAEALERNRLGDYKGARLVLEDAIRGIRRRAHGDAALLAIAAELERDLDELEVPMDVMHRKRMHYSNTTILFDRDETTGRARKPPKR
jgi:Ca-activated chloride channel family protein